MKGGGVMEYILYVGERVQKVNFTLIHEPIEGFEILEKSVRCYKELGMEYRNETVYLPKRFCRIYIERSSEPEDYGNFLYLYVGYPFFITPKRYPCKREKIKEIKEITKNKQKEWNEKMKKDDLLKVL